MVSGSPGVSDQITDNGSFVHRRSGFGGLRVGFRTYPAPGRLSGEFLCGLWATACDALMLPADQIVQSLRVLRSVLPAWTRERIGIAPSEPSYVADDGFPAEMSVNWSGTRPELRLLFDCLGDTRSGGTPRTRRLEQVHEIFTSRVGLPPAPLWHSVAWRPPSDVVHKTYFGLYEWPLPQRYAAVGEAMRQLRMSAAWDHARSWVANAAGRRELEFFAVDLSEETNARVKVYYRNHGASIGEMNRIASVALRHDPMRAYAAYRALTGNRADAGEAALTCLAFRPGLDRAAESTTYLRLSDLAHSDEQAVDRTAALLRGEGVDPSRLRTLAAALAPGPLTDSRGLLALVSYRAAGRRSDVTTYFRFPVYDRSRPAC